jgi:hypothetical protein
MFEKQKPEELRVSPVVSNPAVPKIPPRQAKTPEVTEDDLRRFKLSYGLWL